LNKAIKMKFCRVSELGDHITIRDKSQSSLLVIITTILPQDPFIFNGRLQETHLCDIT